MMAVSYTHLDVYKSQHYLSGAWLFGAYAPEGMNPWWYSFGYNLAYCLPTLIICYIGFALIYPRLNTSIKL